MIEETVPIAAGMPETADREGAFPRLAEDQLTRLRGLGEVRAAEAGEVLFAEGDASSDFFVVLSGALAIVQGYGRENRVIAVHGPGRFTGELSTLTGQRIYLSGVVRDPGEVVQVPIEKLREIVDEDKVLSDLILGAYMARRSILIDAETGIKLIGSRFSPDSRRLREFLARNRMPYQWTDLEEALGRESLPSGEQQRVGVPELLVGGRQLRELSGEVGAGMQLRVREVAPDQTQSVVALEQRFHRPP